MITGTSVTAGVDEWAKNGTLDWFGHVLKINEDDFVKR